MILDDDDSMRKFLILQLGPTFIQAKRPATCMEVIQTNSTWISSGRVQIFQEVSIYFWNIWTGGSKYFEIFGLGGTKRGGSKFVITSPQPATCIYCHNHLELQGFQDDFRNFGCHSDLRNWLLPYEMHKLSSVLCGFSASDADMDTVYQWCGRKLWQWDNCSCNCRWLQCSLGHSRCPKGAWLTKWQGIGPERIHRQE